MIAGRPCGIGLIGCGYAAEVLHIPSLQSLPQARILALVDPDAGRLDKVADRFGIKARHVDYRPMLDNPKIEAVGICVPTEFHAAIATACLEAGKHLLIEKPVALYLEDVDALESRAAAFRLVVAVGFNLRHNANVRAARDIVASGRIGRVAFVRSTWSSNIRYGLGLPPWRKQRALGGGALFEAGSHVVDLWRFVLQAEIEEVFAAARSQDGDDQTVTVSARLSGGALASAVLSQCAYDHNDFEIIGERGRVSVAPYSFAGLDHLPDASLYGRPASKLARIAQLARAFPAAVASARRYGSFRESYRLQWSHFLNSIQHGGPVAATLQDGRRSLEVITALIRSGDEGRAIRLEPPGAPSRPTVQRA